MKHDNALRDLTMQYHCVIFHGMSISCINGLFPKLIVRERIMYRVRGDEFYAKLMIISGSLVNFDEGYE